MDTYHPPDAYAQVFTESSQTQSQQVQPSIQPSVPQVHLVSPSEPLVQKVQSFIPSSTSTPTEWYRHGISTQATVSAPDPSAQENSVLFRFISAQFAAI